jgi:hypothetical protein
VFVWVWESGSLGSGWEGQARGRQRAGGRGAPDEGRGASFQLPASSFTAGEVRGWSLEQWGRDEVKDRR